MEATEEKLKESEKTIQKLEKTESYTQKVTSSDCGFTLKQEIVVDTKTEIEKEKEEQKKYTAPTKEIIFVSSRAQQYGFRPIAIVHRKMWAGFCKRFNLYRFETFDQNDGKVMAMVPHLADIGLTPGIFALCIMTTILLLPMSAHPIVLSVMFICLPGLCLLVEKADVHMEDWQEWSIVAISTFFSGGGISTVLIPRMMGSVPMLLIFLISAVIGFILFFVYLLLADVIVNKIVANVRVESVRKWFLKRQINRRSKIELLQMLWPDGNDVDLPGVPISIHFPAAPKDFLFLLSKVKEVKLKRHITASPGAINISIDELADEKTSRKAYFAQLKVTDYNRWVRECPILSYQDGNYEVILRQFGDFPDEKEVLEWAKKEGVNLYFN